MGSRRAAGLIAVAVSAIVLGIVAIAGGTEQPQKTAPDWLVTDVQTIVESHAVGPVEWCQWVETTVWGVKSAVPEQSSPAPDTSQEPRILVIAEGGFVDGGSIRQGSPAPRGRFLVLEFDPQSRELVMLGLVNSGLNTGTLGTLGDLPLPGAELE